MKFQTLWKGKYASIVSPDIAPYEAMHEPDAIVVIPIVREGKTVKVYVRQEYCPPYFIKDKTDRMYYTVISGKREPNEPAKAAMERELKEEAGVKLVQYKVLFEKDNLPLCKSTDCRIALYVIEIEKFDKVPVTNDGTAYEEKSRTLLMDLDELSVIVEVHDDVDYLLTSSYYMLKGLLA